MAKPIPPWCFMKIVQVQLSQNNVHDPWNARVELYLSAIHTSAYNDSYNDQNQKQATTQKSTAQNTGSHTKKMILGPETPKISTME